MQAVARGVTKLRPTTAWDGTVDALIGGPPCQGFSTGGKREEGDARNEMILEFVRIVEQLRPRVLCLENVSGILDERFASVREEAFRRLRGAGYQLSGTDGTLNAKDFGVPQSRKRVIVLGWRGGDPGVPSSAGRATVLVGEALEGLPNPAHYPSLLSSDQVPLGITGTLLRNSSTGSYSRLLAGLDTPSWDFSHPRVWDHTLLSGSRRTVHSADTIRRFSQTKPGSVEPRSRLFRLTPSGHARTLRAGTGAERGAHTSPRPIHPTQDRVITVREAARLHGYPDWFRFHVTNWHGHRQVGNSVPPPLARAAGEQLIKKLGLAPVRPTAKLHLGDASLLSLSMAEAVVRLGAVTDELPAPRSRPVIPEALAG